MANNLCGLLDCPDFYENLSAAILAQGGGAGSFAPYSTNGVTYDDGYGNTQNIVFVTGPVTVPTVTTTPTGFQVTLPPDASFLGLQPSLPATGSNGDLVLIQGATGLEFYLYDSGTWSLEATILNQLWKDDGTYLRPTLAAQSNSVVINDVTGNVGINMLPSATWENAIGGNTLIDANIVKAQYATRSETEFMSSVAISAVNPYLEITTNIPIPIPLSPQRVGFQLLSEGDRSVGVQNTTHLVGSLTINSAGVSSLEVSSLGDRVSGTTVYAGFDGGVLKLCLHQLPLSGNSDYKVRVTHANAYDSSTWTTAVYAAATPPAWLANPAPQTKFRTGSQFINRFGIVEGANATFSGSVTAASFIVASDPIIKDNTTDLSASLASEILANINVGTWNYNNVMGKGEPSAGITDADKLRGLLPEEMKDSFTPVRKHALGEDPEVLTDITYVNLQFVIAAMLKQVQTNMAEIATLSKVTSAQKTSISTLQKQLASQATTISTQAETIATLEKQSAAQAEVIATLEALTSTHTEAIAKLESQISGGATGESKSV